MIPGQVRSIESGEVSLIITFIVQSIYGRHLTFVTVDLVAGLQSSVFAVCRVVHGGIPAVCHKLFTGLDPKV